ncbi:Laccase-15 [Dichanthelium oligosanthes]|uniref:laccase n=1 Tax=Dichanthelium oligosanthes TaxID=888268 RepID=A0A1E5USP7_9POAL|nr:Laccase-15 [Dichanthelium oligosanthes]
MNRWSLPAASTAIAIAVVFLLSATAPPAAVAAVVEHTFVVSMMSTHGFNSTFYRFVHNVGQDRHGVMQRFNCWADGVPMITQCPILPNHNFTYRFNVAGQEGTLWWHAHISFLRATVHGALVIRPRHGASSYPFVKPYKEIPIIIGEWWQMDLAQADQGIVDNLDVYFTASIINGKLGDLYNCSGAVEDGYMLDVEPGKTYLLRVINAALFSEYYLKIAGHKFTVVAADANYVSPYTTDVIAIAPGETVDALLVANAAPGRYYMVALPNQSPEPDPQSPTLITRGIVQYRNIQAPDNGAVTPEMPDHQDQMTSFYFHGNLTGLHRPERPPVPTRVDERLFVTLGRGTICRRGQSSSCNKSMTVTTMNNISYQQPQGATPLLELHYYNTNSLTTMLQELPDKPPRVFNYTDPALIPPGPKVAKLEPTSKATVARRFRHGAVVEVVFQGTAMLSSESNPMHLHGHDVFVLAHGEGIYDAARDAARYNLVNPALRNTVLVPRLGWVAFRFIADNPGAYRTYWFCKAVFGLRNWGSMRSFHSSVFIWFM